MLLNISKTLTLHATQEETWALLRDIDRLASLIPAIQSVALAGRPPAGGATAGDQAATGSQNGGPIEERYVARVGEKIGPFRLDLSLDIKIVEIDEPRVLNAGLSGADRKGQNRIRGTLRAGLKRVEPEVTLLSLDAAVEVLGKLASLGATPIRRRANEVFDEFAFRVEQQFPRTEEGPVGRDERSENSL